MVDPIGAAASGSELAITRLGLPSPAAAAAAGTEPAASFASIIGAGMQHVESKVATANDLVRQFALDDTVPLHQVTYALEEARLAVELAMQVRGRLVEAYREVMNMQL